MRPTRWDGRAGNLQRKGLDVVHRLPVTSRHGLALLLAMAIAPLASAQERAGPLVVGSKVAPPFVMHEPDGSWTGISIFLWDRIARELDLEYEIRELDLNGLISGAADGTLDAAVAALTITAERERRVDFTHPFYATGLGVVARPKGSGTALGAVRRLLSADFARSIGALCVLLMIVGFIVWLAERKLNAEQFGGSPISGIGSGFWWSAVTMTTVGYGDKAPRSVVGRLVGLVWMFAAIIMISSFTAAITSSLTVSHLESRIRTPADLARVRVAALAGSTSATYLADQGVTFVTVADIEEGVESVDTAEIDAFVHDAPVLRYTVRRLQPEHAIVLPFTFSPQSYGIALPQGSPLREPINRALLGVLRTEEWQATLDRYLGE